MKLIYDISDCIAMSEDGDWYAFPAEMTRGQVIGAFADGGEWYFVLQAFNFGRGFVRESEGRPGRGWWEECEADDDGATRCWTVRRK